MGWYSNGGTFGMVGLVAKPDFDEVHYHPPIKAGSFENVVRYDDCKICEKCRGRGCNECGLTGLLPDFSDYTTRNLTLNGMTPSKVLKIRRPRKEAGHPSVVRVKSKKTNKVEELVYKNVDLPPKPKNIKPIDYKAEVESHLRKSPNHFKPPSKEKKPLGFDAIYAKYYDRFGNEKSRVG